MLKMQPGSVESLNVDAESHGQRIDNFLAQHFPDASRTFFQGLIAKGHVLLNDNPVSKGSTPVRLNDRVHITVPFQAPRPLGDDRAKDLPVNVVFQHEHFLVVEKPAGLVVHQPHANSEEITLVDWLLYHYRDAAHGGWTERPGIVHRLDKDTSGLMLLALTPYAHAKLSDLFKDRRIKKTYVALVEGLPPAKGMIDYRIDRHPMEPIKMACHTGSGRDAVTHYTTRTYFKNHALLELNPLTGRTHQIRVHCKAIEHPLVGDAVYGKRSPLIARHALHAEQLAFEFDGVPYHFSSALPDDFKNALKALNGE